MNRTDWQKMVESLLTDTVASNVEEYCITAASNTTIRTVEPTHSISFHDVHGVPVGTLRFENGVFWFHGNVDESAKQFVDFVIQTLNQKFQEEVTKRVSERIKYWDE